MEYSNKNFEELEYSNEKTLKKNETTKPGVQ